MAQANLLLLEQNNKIIRTMEAAARRSGFRMKHLPWGDDIRKYIRENSVDVVLLNVRQMGTTVRAICQQIREDPQFQRFPLIIVYGKRGKESRHDFLKIGADDFLAMPFTPSELMSTVKARLRPFDGLSGRAPATIQDGATVIEEPLSADAVPEKGSLELLPLASIFARIYFRRESGIFNVFIKKETHTIYFEGGNIIYAESMSRKEDVADFMARHGAGKGSGKEIIAARNQAGGAGCDLREFALVIKEGDLMDDATFQWWLHNYILEMVAGLFPRHLGNFQWQRLPLPEEATEAGVEPVYTPHAIMEGVRRMTKWWAYREMLPKENVRPQLSSKFQQLGPRYGLTLKEMILMEIIDGSRTLKDIREICHRYARTIDNYLYACQQLQLITFREDKISSESEVDLDAAIDEDYEEDFTEEMPPVPAAPVTPPRGVPAPSGTNYSPVSEPILESHDEPVSEPSEDLQFSHDGSDQKKEGQFEFTAGGFSEIPVPELFKACIKDAFSGSMKLKSMGISKEIFWKRGKIIAALSDSPEERLDRFLLNKKLISEDQMKILEQSDNPGSPNSILKHHMLSIEKVFSVVKDQTETILKDVFSWSEGIFSFNETATPPRDTVPMDISSEAMVMYSLRTLSDWSHLEQRLPRDGDLVRIINRHSTRLNLTPLELRIMNVLAEPLPVAEVIRRISHEAEDVRRSLYAMESAGLISRAGRYR